MKPIPNLVLLLATALPCGAAPVPGQSENAADPSERSALEFDGARSYVDVSAAAATFRDFTIAGWFNIGDKGSEQYLFRITNDESRTRRIQITEEEGTVTADIRTQTTRGSVNIYRVASSDFSYGTWVHIAFVREGTRLRLYFNAREVASQTAPDTPLPVDRWAFLGANTWRPSSFGAPSQHFLGFIDEFQIWTVARTAEEIAESMERLVAPTSGFHAHWGFNEGRADRVFDSSGNGFNGIAVKTKWTQPAFAIGNLHPRDGALFSDAGEGIRFTLYTGTHGVDPDAIQLLLNGRDRSADLKVTGSDRELQVEFADLAQDRFYRAEILATDLRGRSLSLDFAFDTFRPVQFQRRARWIGAGIGGTGLAVAFGFVWIGRYRRKRELHALRLRLARDIHDEIGSNLAGITVLSEVACETPATAEERKEDWNEVNRIARETIEAMREVLWLIGGRSETGFDLMTHLQLAASRTLAGIRVHWKSLPESPPPDWRTEDQRQVFLFFKEAMTNIARHAKATRVDISASLSKGRFHLEIADDGRGFNPREIKPGVGLTSQKMRARTLRGSVDIHSEAGRGTRVRLEVPVRRK